MDTLHSTSSGCQGERTVPTITATVTGEDDTVT